MTHIKSRILWLAVIFLSSQVLASDLEADRELTKELRQIEWIGPVRFLELIQKKKLDECKYFEKATSGDVKRVEARPEFRRILLTLEQSSCSNKKEIAERFANSTDPLIQKTAQDVLASATKKSKKP